MTSTVMATALIAFSLFVFLGGTGEGEMAFAQSTVATPANPIAVSSVTDGVDGFAELNDARGITTVTIGSSTYALVAAQTDDGVQIIDITNPATPTAISSVTDATASISSTFDVLDGATGITTVTIGSSTYALVASFNDSGVQIIDISTPASPTAVSSVTDGATFDELNSASGITTVKIGSSTYALVAAFLDDGVQIINITNPAAPTATSSITDGESDGSGGTFDELDGASDISIVQIGESIYALVASENDNGVQIIDITNPAAPTAVSSVTDGATFDELDGAYDITTVTIGQSIYALVASRGDDGVQIINITDPTNPTATSSVTDGATFDELDGALNISTVKIGSATYALVASENDDGVQIINITNPASPTAVSSITDGATFDELDGAAGITTVQIGSSVYALVAASDDDSVQIIRIAEDQPEVATPTNPIAVSSITDGLDDSAGGTFDTLNGPRGITNVQIGTSTYVIVAGNLDHGIQIINMTNPAAPAAVFSIVDGSTDNSGVATYDTLRRAIDVTTVQIDAFTYALVTSNTDDGVQIIDITNPARPSVVSSIIDGGTDGNGDTFDELDGAFGIDTFTIGASTYAIVASLNDDGVQIINITDPKNPTATSSVTDGAGGFNTLDEATGITTVTRGASTYALVAANADDGIQIINITNPAVPTVAASITDGNGGFDELNGATGVTTVTIGAVTYALVTTSVDDAVQIINITNPSVPTAVSAVFDGGTDGTNTFDELNGASNITTIKVGSSTYALVASATDDGVQIIDITDPANPTVASSATHGGSDGSGGTFDGLDSARDVTTIQIDSSIYALVTARDVDAVQIIRIADNQPEPEPEPEPGSASPTNPIPISSIAVNSSLSFNGATGVTTVTIGSSTYALVTSNPGGVSQIDGVQIIDITNPASPTAVSSITDATTTNGSAFDALDGAEGITTVKIGTSTYALVAARDDGVQIINITDPASPTAVTSIHDGDGDGDGGTFDTLATSNNITTVKIGSSVYALVTSSFEDGIQIIDITNPASPIAVTSVIDGSTFDTLDGANDVTTVTIGADTYALVASRSDEDNGVQIINITDPAVPTAVSSISDGDTDGNGNTFDELGNAYEITTITIGSSTYAIVTSSNGVQIINISNPAVPTAVSSITNGDTDGNGSTFTLDSTLGLTAITIGPSTYVLVAVEEDDLVQIIDITDITNPLVASSIVDDNTLLLDTPRDITTVQIDSSIYAIATSRGNSGTQIIQIAEDQPIPELEPASPTNPIPVSSIAANADLPFQSAVDVTTVTIGSSTYALVASNGNDVSIISGVQIIDITDPESPTSVSSITDATATNGSPFDGLIGAYSITTVTIGSSTYALVASIDDVNGVQIIDITDPASPTAVISLADEDTDGSGGTFDTLARPFDVTTVKIGSVTYALVADSSGDGVQIIDISNPAAPTAVSSVIDATNTNGSTFDTLEGAEAITTVTIGSDVYALVASFEDGGIQIINITNPASPTAASSVTTGFSAFDVTTVKIGSSTYALVASSSRIQIINITDPTNPSVVKSIADRDRDNNNSMFRFDAAANITTVTIGSSTYALVASSFIDNLQIINITDPENPLLASLIDNDDTLSLDGPRGISTVQIGSSIYAVIASDGDARTQIIRIAEDQPVPEPEPASPTNPVSVSSVSDGDTDGDGVVFDELDGASAITTVQIGSSVYALVVANLDNGIQIINITDPTDLIAVASITDNVASFDRLRDPFGIATAKIGSSIYALVTSQLENSVQIIDITNPANPTNVSSIGEDIDGFDELFGAFDITTVQIGSSVYALVASSDDAGVQIIDITNPAAPIATSSVTDGGTDGSGGTFDTLSGAIGITTAKIGSATYALVASQFDDGVQIIDITNPATPIATSSVTDGVIFDTLDGAGSITTVQIGSATYALVASYDDDGVQIINITNPAAPTATSSVTDGTIFDELDGVAGITTVKIGSSVYALVASLDDNGVQIINITNPAVPTAASSVTDGAVFDTLVSSFDITTVQIGSSVYALVASQFDDGIQIIRIAEDQPVPEPVPEPVATPENPIPVSSVSDGDDDRTGSTFDELDEPNDITTVKIGSSVYALVASISDSGIQIIDITNPAAPTVASSITDGATFDTLGGARGITTVKIGSATYALVASNSDDGVQIINITNPAAPTAVSSITDGSTFDELDGAIDITTVQIGSSVYALVASFTDDGIQIIDITNPAAPTAVSSITDGGTFDELDGAIGITTVQIGSSIYALVASQTDDGIQIINITNPATPTAVSSITDGDTFDGLDGAIGITTVTIGTSTYALVTSRLDDGIQIINITNPATPTAVSSITDGSSDGNGNTFDELDNATGITTIKIGSATYALVASSVDDGIQIINISNPAAPTVASSLSDGSAFDELDGAVDITTVQIGSSVYALVASSVDDGIQIIRIADAQPIPEPESTINPIAVSALTDGSGGFNVLGTPGDVTTVKIGTSTYAIVSAFADDQGGIQIINMTNPAVPTVASGITTASSGGAARLDGSTGIDTVKIGSDTYVLVAATTDDAVQILNISNPANPIPVFTIRDGNPFDTLDGANSITTVKIGSATYALVASNRDHGIQIIDISNPAAPTAVTSIVDGGTDSASNTFDELLGATSITTVRIGSSLYALVGAFSDNGVQIIDITDPADPLAVSSVSSNSNGFGDLSEANDITTVQIGSDTYALVASRPSNHLQIINISDPANPTHASSIIHDGVDNAGGIFDILEGPSDVTTITLGDSTYAIVSGNIDDGVQFINISNPIMPIAVSSVANGTVDADGTTFTRLDGPIALTTVQIDSSIYTLVASNQGSAGVQIIRIAEASTEPESDSRPPSSSSGGSSSDWKKKPTFGKSWEVSSDQLVKNGFSFNGYSLDITDNWHTDFVKTSTIIGEINHVTMRVFAFDGLRYVQLSLGLPEIGATSDAEADIIVHLERNYDNPNDYDIVGIEHEQKEPLVNTDSTTASITPSLCNTSHTEPFCYTIDIEFAVDAPLSHDVIAISAIDTKRRTTTTHINDGVEFLGESLLPAETASIFIKKTNQGKGNHIILTQDDRRYDTWTDQDGYQWMQNSYGTWIQQTLPDMIISHDGSTQVMTRLHSEFDSMVQQEQERAILVFDSKNIQSVPDEPFSYEFHEIIPRHLDEGLLEKMELEEILALEKMLNIYIYDDNWSEIDDGDDDNE